MRRCAGCWQLWVQGSAATDLNSASYVDIKKGERGSSRSWRSSRRLRVRGFRQDCRICKLCKCVCVFSLCILNQI
jgi:hypothetical protein